MQTSSKVSYDNWSDWNLGDKIMNIRPVGTYCFCHCHHCHNHHHCVDCEFKDSCVKCDHWDGFVEGYLIHKVPENYIPNPIPDNIGNNTDKTEDSSIDTTSCYGMPLVDSIPDEIEQIETSDDVDSILNDVDDLNLNTESTDIFEE